MDAPRHKRRIPPGYDVYGYRIRVRTKQCQEVPERTLTLWRIVRHSVKAAHARQDWSSIEALGH